MGMKEVLQSIKKAEDDAAEALKSASEESAKILSDAVKGLQNHTNSCR